MRFFPSRLFVCIPALFLCESCAGEGPLQGQQDTGTGDTGSSTATSGASGGTANGTGGGVASSGGSANPNSGGGPSSGGSSPSGGSAGSSTGGTGAGAGGDSNGGGPSSGGSSSGGTENGSGGSGSGSGGAAQLDCDATMPASGGEDHSGNGRGGTGNLAWEIWSNTGEGELTTYNTTAFTASWNEAGGYLGRMGFEWGGFNDDPKPYEEHGNLTAQFVSQKEGTGGGYSYIGMYGWSVDPCVEWYVVEDAFKPLPFDPDPANTTFIDDVTIDGASYAMYTRQTTGSGGTRCSGENQWIQYYSVRDSARACGTISLTEHFDAWKSLNMPLGDLLEAKIIVEVGGGVGKVDFPVANVIEAP